MPTRRCMDVHFYAVPWSTTHEAIESNGTCYMTLLARLVDWVRKARRSEQYMQVRT